MQSFDNISFHISPNNEKLDISKIYTKWAVEKSPIWNFQTPGQPRNSRKKSAYSIAGHPVNKKETILESKVLSLEILLTFSVKLNFGSPLYRGKFGELGVQGRRSIILFLEKLRQQIQAPH